MTTTHTGTDPWGSDDHDPLHPAAIENACADWDLEIEHHRGHLLASLDAARSALTHAAGAVAALLSDGVYDVEFTETSAGQDISAFTDDSLRYARAAHALTRQIIDRG